MSRLIDADALMEQMKRRKEFVGRLSDPVCLVEDAPTIDAEPVRHGHWIEQDGFYGDTYYDCSACGHSWVTIEGTPQDNEMNYCPYCGAHMDEVISNGR